MTHRGISLPDAHPPVDAVPAPPRRPHADVEGAGVAVYGVLVVARVPLLFVGGLFLVAYTLASSTLPAGVLHFFTVSGALAVAFAVREVASGRWRDPRTVYRDARLEALEQLEVFARERRRLMGW